MDDRDERPRGILSPADRRFLRGDADLQSEQSVYDARYRIRQRVHNALLDFSLLFERLDDRDREQVFDGSEDLTAAIVDAVAFLYLGATGAQSSREILFTEGLQRAEQRRTGGQPTAHVEVGAADRDRLERIVETIESGRLHELSESELRAFAHLCGGNCGRTPREALSAVFDGKQ